MDRCPSPVSKRKLIEFAFGRKRTECDPRHKIVVLQNRSLRSAHGSGTYLVSKNASSEEFVGEFWFGEGSKVVIEGGFVGSWVRKPYDFLVINFSLLLKPSTIPLRSLLRHETS